MSAPLVAPLIPPRARPGGREQGRRGAARSLPVAAGPEVPAFPDDVAYGLGRMDESGRVADRAMIGALGWHRGDRLTLTAAAGPRAMILSWTRCCCGCIPRRPAGGAARWHCVPLISIPSSA
jgi:hypothetical protein